MQVPHDFCKALYFVGNYKAVKVSNSSTMFTRNLPHMYLSLAPSILKTYVGKVFSNKDQLETVMLNIFVSHLPITWVQYMRRVLYSSGTSFWFLVCRRLIDFGSAIDDFTLKHLYGSGPTRCVIIFLNILPFSIGRGYVCEFFWTSIAEHTIYFYFLDVAVWKSSSLLLSSCSFFISYRINL
jgi:hypothetical protein